MKPDIERELLHLDTDKKELNLLQTELEKDQRIQEELQKKLADIDEAIALIRNKIEDLEKKLAQLKKPAF